MATSVIAIHAQHPKTQGETVLLKPTIDFNSARIFSTMVIPIPSNVVYGKKFYVLFLAAGTSRHHIQTVSVVQQYFILQFPVLLPRVGVVVDLVFPITFDCTFVHFAFID